MQCIICIVFYALYYIHCILFIVLYKLYYLHCILYIVFSALYSMHCTLCIVLGSLYTSVTPQSHLLVTPPSHLLVTPQSHLGHTSVTLDNSRHILLLYMQFTTMQAQSHSDLLLISKNWNQHSNHYAIETP